MHRYVSPSLIALAVFGSGVLFTGAASARTVMGFTGTARSNADRDCFAEAYGSATNLCSTSKDINYSGAIDASGTYTTRVYTTASVVTSGNTCQNGAITATGGVITGNRATWTIGNSVALDVPGVPVPFGGGVWMVCSVPSGGKIHTVNFRN